LPFWLPRPVQVSSFLHVLDRQPFFPTSQLIKNLRRPSLLPPRCNRKLSFSLRTPPPILPSSPWLFPSCTPSSVTLPLCPQPPQSFFFGRKRSFFPFLAFSAFLFEPQLVPFLSTKFVSRVYYCPPCERGFLNTFPRPPEPSGSLFIFFFSHGRLALLIVEVSPCTAQTLWPSGYPHYWPYPMSSLKTPLCSGLRGTSAFLPLHGQLPPPPFFFARFPF